jgi:hypothetical protein
VTDFIWEQFREILAELQTTSDEGAFSQHRADVRSRDFDLEIKPAVTSPEGALPSLSPAMRCKGVCLASTKRAALGRPFS